MQRLIINLQPQEAKVPMGAAHGAVQVMAQRHVSVRLVVLQRARAIKMRVVMGHVISTPSLAGPNAPWIAPAIFGAGGADCSAQAA